MSSRNKVKIYSIILANHGKQYKVVCSEKTEKEIYKRFKELLQENKSVNFPMRFNNEQHVMIPSEHEIIIIKCKQDNDKNKNKVRDNAGEFINYETDNEDWIVIDRAEYNVEETFWVYGYHPRFRRKDFAWILENLIGKNGNDKYNFKRIVLFLNKLLIDTNGNLEMVICKNKSDAIRLYNLLEERSMKKKWKSNLFLGDVTKSKYRKEWVDKIKALTNWNDVKIKRSSTRP